MKKSQLWIIIVLIVVLMGVGLWYVRTHRASLGLSPGTHIECRCPEGYAVGGSEGKFVEEIEGVNYFDSVSTKCSSDLKCAPNPCYKILSFKVDDWAIYGLDVSKKASCSSMVVPGLG